MTAKILKVNNRYNVKDYIESFLNYINKLFIANILIIKTKKYIFRGPKWMFNSSP